MPAVRRRTGRPRRPLGHPRAEPCCEVSQPSAMSSAYARATVFLATPRSTARARLDGNRVSGATALSESRPEWHPRRCPALCRSAIQVQIQSGGRDRRLGHGCASVLMAARSPAPEPAPAGQSLNPSQNDVHVHDPVHRVNSSKVTTPG